MLLNHRVFALATVVFSMAFAAHSFGQDTTLAFTKTPQAIQFRGLPGTVQHAFLIGDWQKPGYYAIRARYPKGVKVMPHFHTETIRSLVVLSGTIYYAFGEEWDETKLAPLPPGSFISEPRGVPHFLWAKDSDVVIEITGMGPGGPGGTKFLHDRKSPGPAPESGSSP